VLLIDHTFLCTSIPFEALAM